ncbi:IS66 family insertion sequence element accessory protein TnpB [Paraburkholderia aspalathi]|uniref:IS66 family insertion sequence element accessory protein TnpB n=1 Tax=Paraburkholderia aspalathi TaxID=1324617 RepID=UPI0038BB157B
MFRFDASLAVRLHRDPVDFRESINGLTAIIEQSLALDPFAAAVYGFTNRRRDRIKLIFWDKNGFWLLLKRLEGDRFKWPRRQQAVVEITIEQLQWLFDEIDIDAMKRHSKRRVG